MSGLCIDLQVEQDIVCEGNVMHRFEHHLENIYQNYANVYGYDVEGLYDWLCENEPCSVSDDNGQYMEILLSDQLNIYGYIAEECRALGVSQVLDIGCADGIQARLFESQGISYVGVEPYPISDRFYDAAGGEFYVSAYPSCGNLGISCGVSARAVGTGIEELWVPQSIYDDFDLFVGCCYLPFFDELGELYPNSELVCAQNPVDAPHDMNIMAFWK